MILFRVYGILKIEYVIAEDIAIVAKKYPKATQISKHSTEIIIITKPL